jgi:hypothetical protein
MCSARFNLSQASLVRPDAASDSLDSNVVSTVVYMLRDVEPQAISSTDLAASAASAGRRDSALWFRAQGSVVSVVLSTVALPHVADASASLAACIGEHRGSAFAPAAGLSPLQTVRGALDGALGRGGGHAPPGRAASMPLVGETLVVHDCELWDMDSAPEARAPRLGVLAYHDAVAGSLARGARACGAGAGAPYGAHVVTGRASYDTLSRVGSLGTHPSLGLSPSGASVLPRQADGGAADSSSAAPPGVP